MDIKYLVIHCSDSPENMDIGASDIHQWHQQRKWAGIGYHYVIKRNGIIQTGRPEYWQGAHAKGHNHESLGICLIGKDKFTNMQFDALHGLLDTLKNRHPHAVVVGHCDLTDKKTCPNFDVISWWRDVA